MSARPLNPDDLTIEQKIGQMLLARRPRSEADKAEILELIRNRKLGGIHLGSSMDTSEYLAAADYPILVCDNMEEGFTAGELEPVCPLAVSAAGTEEAAYEWAKLCAIQAKARGFNVVFGPIVDIAMNPRSSCVGPRTFGGDKETVARVANAAIRGYQDHGMVVTAKHFPGFGESHVDSHIGMVYLQGDRESLIERDLYPYASAVAEADLSGVMVGHIMAPKVDPEYPATLSPKLMALLREIGFDGLAMTDSFAMVGLTNMYGLKECHGMAMAAGNDMVMTSYRLEARAAYAYMLEAFEKGVVTEEQIDAAVRRVAAAQARTLAKPEQAGLSDGERAFSRTVTEQAMTAVLNGADSPAIPTDGRHLFIVATGNPFESAEGVALEGRDQGKVTELIGNTFPKSDLLAINEFPSRNQMENALKVSMDYESLVFIVFNRTVAYMGSSDLTRRMLALIEGCAHKTSAVVLFGNPYAARELPPLKRLVFAYEGGWADEAAFKVLSGELEAKGRLPLPVRLGGG